MDEDGSPTPTPAEPCPTYGTPEQIAEVTAQIEAARPGRLESAATLKAFRQLCIKKGQLSRRRDKMVRNRPALRIVRATIAERTARKGLEEASALVEDTARILRSGVNVYGNLAQTKLAPFLCKELESEDKHVRWKAAEMLHDIFTKIVEIQSDMRGKKAGKVRTEWPSEGAKS